MQAAKSLTGDPRWVRRVQRLVEEAAILDEDVERAVFTAFAAIPRIGFAEGCTEQQALDDIDLPLSHGEWLTRPSIQIRMMALLGLRRRMRVLELGFGSGYLCAVMAAGGAQVFGLEHNTSVAQASRHLGATWNRRAPRRGAEGVGRYRAVRRDSRFLRSSERS
jgi:protein-L-isoaspartate(D-aspartate) O-methyltransferase